VRIEIQDGFSFEEGILIITVDGKQFPYSSKKTLAQLCEDIKKIPLKVSEPILKPVDMSAGGSGLSNPNIIERGDIVKYIGEISEDNKDLTHEDEYRIIPNEDGYVGSGNTYDIMSLTHPVPIRLVVKKEWVKLFKKNTDKPVIKKSILEAVVKCDKCQQEVALSLADSKYTGKCLKCGNVIEKTQEEIAPKKVEV
jgi:hypothetical protein